MSRVCTFQQQAVTVRDIPCDRQYHCDNDKTPLGGTAASTHITWTVSLGDNVQNVYGERFVCFLLYFSPTLVFLLFYFHYFYYFHSLAVCSSFIILPSSNCPLLLLFSLLSHFPLVLFLLFYTFTNFLLFIYFCTLNFLSSSIMFSTTPIFVHYSLPFSKCS